MSSFHGFGFLPSLRKTLDEQNFRSATEIQAKALPILLKGDSVVGIAETGSGKTLAYALPMMQRLKLLEESGYSISEPGQPWGLVLVPSSDLGEQVSKVFKAFTHDTRLRVRVAIGGMAMKVARKNVSGPFEILLATPGRLEQLMERKLVSLEDLKCLVLDEADQILDRGFLPAVQRVLAKCPLGTQKALFSATASDAVHSLMEELFSEAELVESSGRHKTVSSLVTENIDVPNGQRFPVLEEVPNQPAAGGTLIFCNTRDQCDALAAELDDHGYPSAIYRGDMDKKERRQNLRSFRDGEVEILVSTELGSRGLDVENVDRVINYHLPKELKNYLHRAGRTARAGRSGTVINLVTRRDANLMKRLESS
ncbi:MAG: DEAD/DEAH box helicase [Verrucomicrobiota bacterium]